jgi:hypothetical protein
MWHLGREIHIRQILKLAGFLMMKLIRILEKMFSGESEINCYCHDEYSFDEEQPENYDSS